MPSFLGPSLKTGLVFSSTFSRLYNLILLDKGRQNHQEGSVHVNDIPEEIHGQNSPLQVIFPLYKENFPYIREFSLYKETLFPERKENRLCPFAAQILGSVLQLCVMEDQMLVTTSGQVLRH